MSWEEILIDKETLIKSVEFIHKQSPNYISGKKYRLPGDIGHRSRNRSGEQNAQFTRKNYNQMQIRIIDGERTICVDRDDMFGDEYTIKYATTYNHTFTFDPCKKCSLSPLTTYLSIAYNSAIFHMTMN